MASLATETVKSTFSGLLKTSDSGARGAQGSADQCSDGAGNTIPLFVSATEVYSVGSGTGTSHTAFGKGCGVDLSTGTGNSLFGEGAGAVLSTGEHNVVVGYHALYTATDDSDDNVAIGYNAMSGTIADEEVHDCVAIGSSALSGALDSSDGADEASGTVAIGKSALAALTDGAKNIAIGYRAGVEINIGDNNTAIGYAAMGDSLAGLQNDDNTFVGQSAGGGTWASNACSYNTAVGSKVMDAAMNGALNNTAVGYESASAITTALRSTSMGTGSLKSMTTGNDNTAIGYNAMNTANHASASGNVAIGSYTLDAISSNAAAQNTALGYNSGTEVTSGDRNTFVGYASGDTVTTGSYHTQIGYHGALRYMTAYLNMSGDADGSFTNADTDNIPATASLLTIPRYGFLKRVTCTVVTASGGGTGVYNISVGTDSVAAGTAMANRIELIGAGSTADTNFTGATFRQSEQSADGDSRVDITTVKRVHIWEADQATDDSNGWTLFEAQARYLYVCHAHASNAEDAQDAVLRITAEYWGEE